MIHAILVDTMKEQPRCSFAVFEACRSGPSQNPATEQAALAHIRAFQGDMSDASSFIACLSPAVLEEILKDPEVTMMDLKLFQMLTSWEQGGTSDDEDNTPQDYRRSTAKELAEHINLEGISQYHLTKTVQPSGLVSEGKLSDVREKLAEKNLVDLDRYFARLERANSKFGYKC
ncbi:expressed unknown protein [Seminavis robusta]|uniref:Uncharacterized protein n=1 Tax=Seminavis robusta TaxID=568900 RepID=A0A9N8H5Z9_9STRA|nr:expressed unknown protein [Seminavis robusta]|eukprot:Sro130_g061870.1 n/a (174) ;mRNA; f:40876-41397